MLYCQSSFSSKTQSSSSAHYRKTERRTLRVWQQGMLVSTVLVFILFLLPNPGLLVHGMTEVHYPDKVGVCRSRRTARCSQGTGETHFFEQKRLAKKEMLEGLGYNCLVKVLRPEPPCPKKEVLVPIDPAPPKPCEDEIPKRTKEIVDFIREGAEELLNGAAEAANILDKIISLLISITTINRCGPVIDLKSKLLPTKCPTDSFKCTPMEPCAPDSDPAPNSGVPFVVEIKYPIKHPVESEIYSPDPEVAKKAQMEVNKKSMYARQSIQA